MKVLSIYYAMISSVALLGCTTSHVTPDIQTFGKTVSDIVAADRATPRGTSLAGRVQAAKRADFASNGVLYFLDDDDNNSCNYNRPDLKTETFAEGCVLEPNLQDKTTGQQVLVASQYDTLAVQKLAKSVIGAGDQELLKELVTDRLKTDLLAYADQLKALTEATEPNDISVAAGKAFDQVLSLSDEVERSVDVTNSGQTARRAANRTLLTTLAREAFETQRYKLLKSIVVRSNGTVAAAAMELAVLSFPGERAALEIPKNAFKDAANFQEVRSVQSLKAVEDSYASLAKRDQNAAFRRYTRIAQAHAAIVQSMNAPADLGKLTAANQRIVALSQSIQAVD